MRLTDLFSPMLFLLSPEQAHELSIAALKTGIGSLGRTVSDERLEVSAAGLDFPNPVGLAAGYDKNAEVPDQILALGFGFAEVGTLTPRAQYGNPKPRIFRLVEHRAVINRLGFNNDGHEAAVERLKSRRAKGGIIGVNIGANKDSEDFVSDYEKGLDAFYDLASYFTVNISSPNTPGLRNLQAGDALQQLLNRVFDKADQLQKTAPPKPIFLKIAPDLGLKDMDEIAKVISSSRLDGLVVSNTTIDRTGIERHRHAGQSGGLSGEPLFDRSTRVLAQMRLRLGNELPIIGVGGVSSAKHAIEKLEAGANLIQLYTGLIFRGPGLASEICRGILRHLDASGLDHVSELTGSRNQLWCQETKDFE